MINLDSSAFNRNPEKLKTLLWVNDDVTIANSDLYVYIPSRFIDRGFTVIGSTVRTVAIFIVATGSYEYSVVSVPTAVELNPQSIDEITIDDVSYIKLTFPSGSVVIVSNTLVVSTEYLQDLSKEIFQMGNVPWYMSYEDISRIFSKSTDYCGNGIGENQFIFSIFTSVIARSRKDKSVFYRQTDMKDKPVFVGLSDIRWSYRSTGAKLIGGYMAEGLTNSVVRPETSTSPVVELLRK
jgi:hypothetical protein